MCGEQHGCLISTGLGRPVCVLLLLHPLLLVCLLDSSSLPGCHTQRVDLTYCHHLLLQVQVTLPHLPQVPARAHPIRLVTSQLSADPLVPFFIVRV